MKRDELEHVLRASAAITRDHAFVVIGSRAVLRRHRPIELPRLLTRLQVLAPTGARTDRLVAWAHLRAQEAQS